MIKWRWESRGMNNFTLFATLYPHGLEVTLDSNSEYQEHLTREDLLSLRFVIDQLLTHEAGITP